MMLDEEMYIGMEFQKNFEQYRNENIAIYGLGKKTEFILNHIKNFKIVGLMDEINTGKVVWGLPVISCEEAYAMDVKRIIIVARAANVSIIYNRISSACHQLGIRIYDVYGNELKKRQSEYICPSIYQDITKENLITKIKACDVVSFDIFDTLLMRKVLYPTDIFYLVQKEAIAQKIIDKDYDFYKERIQAERELYLYTNPNIYEIYEKMTSKKKISSQTAQKLLALEIQEEEKQIVVRKDMLTIVELAMKLGKEVCCTSDMYLTRKLIKKLLDINGLEKINTIFVSCEYKTSKSESLFELVKANYPGKCILHIGDNMESDINSAIKNGINLSFHINSASEMLSDSAISGILKYTDSFANRIYIGKFISQQFSSPFVFSESKGKCVIRSCFQLGYELIAPIFMCFVKWLIETAKRENIDVVLLGARDGWLINQILSIFKRSGMEEIPFLYFYTSRQACILAGIRTEQDILEAYELPFTGTVREKLLIRFGLQENELLDKECNESNTDYLLRHSKLILKHSREYRECYKKYRSGLKFSDNSKVGFFDFVSAGTCQKWLERIFSWNMIGLYFLKMYDKDKSGLSIRSFYQQESFCENKSFLFQNYFYLENIMASTEPSLRCFDGKGNPVFEQESRSEKQRNDIENIQNGILEAINSQMIYSGVGEYISKEMADFILSFMCKEYSILYLDCFEHLQMKDEFCNREFEVNSIGD